MKALLLKDFFTLRQKLNWFAILIIVFIIFSFFLENTILLLTFGFIYSTMLITTLFTFDEMSHWDQFVNTLPIRKAIIVKSRYVLSFIFTFVFFVIVSPLIFIQNEMTSTLEWEDLLSIVCFIMATSFILNAIMIPLYVKFGTQKARIALLSIVFIPILFMNLILEQINGFISDTSIGTLYKISYSSPLIALGIFILSYFVSKQIYLKKEF